MFFKGTVTYNKEFEQTNNLNVYYETFDNYRCGMDDGIQRQETWKFYKVFTNVTYQFQF